MKQVKIVENVIEAKNVVEQLKSQGYTKNEINVLQHDQEQKNSKKVGVVEEGEFDSLAHVVSSRGEEMRSHMKSLGLSEQEAQHYEENLDKGYLAVVANKVI